MTRKTLIAFLLLTGLAWAGGEKADQEVRAARKRIRAWLQEARELEQNGRERKAEELRRRADELEARLRGPRERREREGGGRRKLVGVLEGLERGIEALKEMGRHEEASHLGRAANDVRRKLEAMEERRRAGDAEREVARDQIRVMRIAIGGLVEAGKRDAAERVEQAILATELALAGRRDEEAVRIRETAPERGQRIELLTYAAELLWNQGRKKEAKCVGGLARSLRGDGPRGKKSRGDRPRGDKSCDDGPRGEKSRGDRPRGDRSCDDRPRRDKSCDDEPRGDRPRRLEGRISRLEARVVALERALQEIVRRLQK